MRVLSSLLILHFILILQITSNCQTASTGNGLSEIYPTPNISSSINSHDPIHEWPVCTDPKDIIITEDRENFIITWDGSEKTSDKFQYEVIFTDESGKRVSEPTYLNKNYFTIEKNALGRTDKLEIRIRRICFSGNNERIFSNWGGQVLASTGGPCSPSSGTISAPSCVFVSSTLVISNVSLPTGCSSNNYTYTWERSVTSASSGFTTISGTSSSLTTTVSSSPTTYYYRRKATCSGGQFCTNPSSTFMYSNVVSVITQTSFNASISGNGTICSGLSTSLTASGGISYSWSNNLGTSQTVTVSPISTTTYTVTVTNSSGCTKTATKTVTVNASPVPIISGPSQICQGQSAILTASGGSAYQWSNNLGNQSSITVSPTTTTTYTVTVSNSFGCSNTTTKTLTVDTNPIPNISGPTQICPGNSAILIASSGAIYNWSNNETSASITVSPTTSTTYSVTISQSNGCSAIAAQTINVNNATVASITPGACSSQNNSYSVTATLNFVLPYTGTVTLYDNSGVTNTWTISNQTTFTGTLNNINSNGSTHSLIITLSNCNSITSNYQAPNPCVSCTASISGNTTICLGGTTTLTAFQGSSYAWNNGATTQAITISPSSTATFTVTITHPNGGVCSASANVVVNPLPNININGPSTICTGESATLSASGGGAYHWNTGSNNNSISVSPTSPTSYTVTVTNSNSCTASLTHLVVPTTCSGCQFSIIGTNNICIGQSSTLTVQTTSGNCSGISYLWNSGQSTSSIVVTPYGNATYTVTVTNQGGQTTTSSFTVNVNMPPNAIITGDSSICSGQTTTLFADTCPNCSYAWSNGCVVSSTTVSEGIYTVTVTQNGCSSNATKQVSINCNLQCDLNVTQISVSNCNNNLYSLIASGTVINPLGDSVLINVNNNNYFVTLSQNGNFNFQVNNLTADGASHPIMISMIGCDTISQNYQAPSNCESTGSFAYNLTNCDVYTNTYDINIILNVDNPVPGQVVTFTEGGTSYVNLILGTATQYNVVIENIVANGDASTILMEAPWGNATESYTRVASCIPEICNISDIELATTPCNNVTNKFTITGTFTVTKPVASGYFILSTNGGTYTQNINSTGAPQYSFEIPNLTPDGSEYTVSVFHVDICGDISAKIKAPSSCNQLPEYKCGVNNSAPSSTNNTPLAQASAGDVFYINDIAFRADTILGGSGLFSGVGSMSIPFSAKKLKVRFTNIAINSSYHVTSGTVSGVRAVPGENFNIPQNPMNIGGDICVVKPAPEGKDADGFDKTTGLNDKGFDRDGKFQPGNKTYNPQGYDYKGNHKDTGTPYDSFGCDIEGLTIDKKPCERDSTLIAKRDSVLNIVTDSIPNVINNTKGDIQKKLNALKCDSLSARITTLIGELGLTGQSQYIIGATGEYVQKGMHTNFATEPKQLLDNSGRNPLSIELEKTHVALYKCDLFRAKFEKILAQLNNVDPVKFENFVTKEINKLTKDQLDAMLADNAVLMEWLLAMVVEYAENPDAYGYINSLPRDLDRKDLKFLKIKESKSSAFYSIAGVENYDYNAKPGEEEIWLFQQEFREIKGVNRALYLESLYDEMQQYAPGVLSGNEDVILSPIPLIKDVEGVPYKIFLDNIEITPNNAKLNAFFVFQDPGSTNGQKLVMMAENLNWGTGGMIGETTLKLKTPLDIRLSNAVMLHLLAAPASGTSGCSVSWDCSGFTAMKIDAKVELCRNFIVPLDPTTLDTIPAPTRYSFDFNLEIKGWHDIYLEFNNTANKPFAIAGYTDYKWNVSGVVIDNSDLKSPSGIAFSPGYNSPHLSGTGNAALLGPTWRGVTMKTLSVTLPPNFKKNGAPVSIGVQNLIIDDTGVNGRVFGTNLIPYETGNLAGWQFSIDTIKLDIVQNHINGGGMAGKLRVPVLKNPTRYSAMIYTGGRMEFSMSPSQNEKMDFLLADVILKPNSSITAKISNNNTELYAVLHGNLEIKGGEKLKIPKVTFENFKVGNVKPYFNAGTWKIENKIQAKFLGFELNVSNIMPFSPEDGKAGVAFDANLSLPLDIKAGGGLEIIGKMEVDALNRQNWIYEDTRVKKMKVDATIAAGRLFGFLESFDNTTSNGYGEGFHGMIDMDFTNVAQVKAVALFSTIENDKFFYIDAAASLGTGIPMGPFSITGFAGGASYKMEETNFDNDPPDFTKDKLPTPGQSLSGTKYVYNPARGLGLKAGITIALTSSSEAFNGSLVFGILFNSPDNGGGLAEISLDGKGQFMMNSKITGPKIEASENSAPSGVNGKIKAHVRFKYDFNKSEFSGYMAAFINAPGLQGTGKVKVLANSSDWYLYIGTPDEPIKLTFKIGPLTAEGETYLDIGSIVPNMKPIPANVMSVVGNKVKQSSLRASGGGFVFGASLKTSISANAIIASAELKAEVGFDVMIRNFGNASCASSPGEKIGINGWYAMGQMYAYLEGSLKILGVNIFKAAMAGVLQAELPNPFFGQATFGVKIKTFFGSFNKSVALTLGERCEVVGDPTASPLGMKVISNVNPADKAEKMETDFVPSASFNMPMNAIVEMGSDKWKPYLKKFTLTSLKNGYNYPVDSIFSQDRASFEAKPKNLFNAGDSIKFEVEVMVTKNGGSPIYESKSTIFTVGKGYSTIPLANIESSYPINGMKHFYRKENVHGTGFIQLEQGMPELFYNIPSGVTQKLRISPKNGEPIFIDYSYDGFAGRINFEMKPEWFSAGQEYKIEIVRTGSPIETTASSGGQSAGQQGSNINLGSALGNPGVPPGSANSVENPEPPGETILASLAFRVSTYDRFINKLDAGTISTFNWNPAVMVPNEGFDNVELSEMLDIKLNDPNNWMTIEAYNKIFTVNIDLRQFGCGIVEIVDGQLKYDDLNDEIYFANKNGSGYIVNNVYIKALGYYEDLKWAVNGCDVGNANEGPTVMDDLSMSIWLLNNFPLNVPSPPLNTIVTYSIPGLGTTTTKVFSF